jgi:DNA-binding LacI/PurR family transcriptional regulator
MTLAEQAIQQLRIVRYTPSLKEVASRAGVHRATLYLAINSGRISPAHAEAVVRAFQGVQKEPSNNRRSAAG